MVPLEPTPAPALVQYRDVAGFPGYCVGDDGSVWTCKHKGGNDRTAGRVGPWRRLSHHKSPTGYHLVNLDMGGKNHVRQVHRLVLVAFVGPPAEGQEACHYPDSDKGNNRLANLRWDTHGENAKDRYRDRPPATEKFCRRCGLTKPVIDFYRDKRASDGLCCYCKPCHCRLSTDTCDLARRRARRKERKRG